jgi:hypothetical protein
MSTTLPTFDLAFKPMLTVPAWANAFLQAGSRAVEIAVAAQQVIVVRLTMLAVDGNTAANRKEVERMFTEKMNAVNESSAVLVKLATTMAQALPTTFFDAKAAERMLTEAAHASNKALRPFHWRVTANQKRLSA